MRTRVTLVRGTSSCWVGDRSEIQRPGSIPGQNGIDRLDSLNELPTLREAIDVWTVFITYPEPEL
jgi:hypothetical protein